MKIKRILTLILVISGFSFLLAGCNPYPYPKKTYRNEVNHRQECVNLSREIALLRNDPAQIQTFKNQPRINRWQSRYDSLDCSEYEHVNKYHRDRHEDDKYGR